MKCRELLQESNYQAIGGGVCPAFLEISTNMYCALSAYLIALYLPQRLVYVTGFGKTLHMGLFLKLSLMYG